MSGTKEQRPRWKRMLDAEEDAHRRALGQVWVKKYCSPATKARYEKLTDDIFERLPRPHPQPAVDERSHQGERALAEARSR